MINFRLTRPAQLAPSEISLWDRLQRQNDEFESPYFRHEFMQTVDAIRDDVEIAVVEEGGKAIGFFPFQRSPLNLGQPVAGRLNDFHGVLLPRGFRIDARQLIRATNLASWDFDHFVGDQPSFLAGRKDVVESAYIDMPQGYAAYCEENKRSGSEIIRKTISRQRKFEREVGGLNFELNTTRPDEVLATLIAWKVAQFERTGYMNLFAFDWTSNLLRKLLTGHLSLSGVLSALWHNDQPVAISYKLRSFHIAHAWFIAYNPEFSTYSPGMILMLKVLDSLAAQGVKRLHLGSGDQRFKDSLSNGSVPVSMGSIEFPAPSTLLRNAWRWTRDVTTASPFLSSCAKAPVALLKPFRSWLAFR
jgi:CelD/BcsL family acetyltransferase involved in cellulose biosynthesis